MNAKRKDNKAPPTAEPIIPSNAEPVSTPIINQSRILTKIYKKLSVSEFEEIYS